MSAVPATRNPQPDLNTPAGCRAQAVRFRGPDPCPLLALIGECDWQAEAALIEREAGMEERLTAYHVTAPGHSWLTLRAVSAGQAAITAAEQTGRPGRYDVRHGQSHNRVGLFDVTWCDAGESSPAGWRAVRVAA